MPTILEENFMEHDDEKCYCKDIIKHLKVLYLNLKHQTKKRISISYYY
jgi:hypothetical protein